MPLNYRLRVAFPVTQYRTLQAQWGYYTYTGRAASLNYIQLPSEPPSSELFPVGAELAFSDVGYTYTSAGWNTNYGQWRVDQGLGPGEYYSSLCCVVKWANAGGDWYDLNGVPQGTTPFGLSEVIPLRANQSDPEYPVDVTVTSLVQGWLSGTWPNYGFMVLPNDTGSHDFRSRFYPDNTKRPVLYLTINDTVNVVTCARSVTLYNDSSQPAGSPQTLKTSGNYSRTLLWFDLSAYEGQTVTLATVRLHLFATWDPPYTGRRIKIMRLWNPGDSGTMSARQEGIAASYPNDVGIENHADVLYVQKFETANYASTWQQTISAGVTYMTGPDSNGFTPLAGMYNAIKCHVPIGANGNIFEANWSPWNPAVGTHTKPLQDLESGYCRYYLFPGLNANPRDLGAGTGKLPGVWSRYLSIPGMGIGNSGSGADGFCGWSARGSYDPGKDGDDPLHDFFAIGFCGNYNVDSVDTYGGVQRLDRHYLGFLRKGHWHSVEYYIQLNTVTQPTQKPRRLSGITVSGTTATATLMVAESDPLYATGQVWSIGGTSTDYTGYVGWRSFNGPHTINVLSPTQFQFTVPAGTSATASTSGPLADGDYTWMVCCPGQGNNDGILRVWTNGRIAADHTDMRWRHTRWVTDGSRPYGIDEFMFTLYHGGTAPSTTAWDIYFSNFVVSKSYIGPMPEQQSPLPAWLSGAAVNEWVQVPGLMKDMDWTLQRDAGLANIDGTPTNSVVWGQPVYGPVWGDSGGGFKETTSELLIWGGGGAGSWAGNEVRSLNLEADAPGWQTLCAPAPTSDLYVRFVDMTPHPYTRSGKPQSGHSYHQIQFIEAQNKMYLFGKKNVPETDSGDYYMVDALSFANLPTTNQPAWESNPSGHPDIPFQRGWDGNWCGKHPITEEIWMFTLYKILRYDPFANSGAGTWTTVADLVGANVDLERTAAAIDPTQGSAGTILCIGGAYGTGTALEASMRQVRAVDCATGVVRSCTVSGPYAGTQYCGGPWFATGLVWEPDLGKFIHSIDDGYLYTLAWNGPNDLYVDRMTLTGTPPPLGLSNRTETSTGGFNPAARGPEDYYGASNGYRIDLMGRMWYVPNLKGVVMYPNPWRNAYFVRTSQ